MVEEQTNFLEETNQQVLWEVMKDNGILDNTSMRTKMFKTFLIEFNEKYKNQRMDLMDLNKMFIQLMIQKIGRETINESELTTNQQIKQHRKNEFERMLEQKQNEFTNGINKKVPEKPKFEDDMDEEKVSDTSMAKTIQEMIKERNLDITYSGTQKKDAEEWLGSSATSSRAENNNNKKILTLKNPDELKKQEMEKIKEAEENFKFINISEEELGEDVQSISLDDENINKNNLTKKVSWQDSLKETETSENTPLTTSDLFSKLKRTDFSSDSDPIALEKVIPDETNLVTKEDLENLFIFIDQKFKRLEDIILSFK
tara:strand:- start:420 stop:1364 length:945 start_codon:yes stop_codon:yes gene_type:complete